MGVTSQKVTWVDTRPASGLKNAGTHCLYCGEALGCEHKSDCVCRRKVIIVRMTIEFPRLVPESWTPDDIDFHHDGWSWCYSNAIGELARIYNDSECRGICACGRAKFEVLDVPLEGFAQDIQRVEDLERESEEVSRNNYIERGFVEPTGGAR